MLVPFLVEHSCGIVGALVSFLILILKPSTVESSADQTYTDDITDEEDLFNGHRVFFFIGFVIAILISTYSWLVIFTLYQQYTFLRLTLLKGASPFAVAMHPSVAIIENGYSPTYSRNKVGVQRKN